MRADYVLDYEFVTLDRPQKIHLMARFVSGPAPQDQTRRPLNLSLVIDRSGSMGGDKLDYTRQAAQFMVQNLGTKDTLSIVLYNDTVEVLMMPEKVQRKDVINQRISSIKARGTTNLSSGWLEGCNLVAKNLEKEQVNRVILMSDGLANRGVISTSQLVTMAQQKYAEGISTTTMGLGSDFNEDLLMEIASAGGGAFYFIESPESAPLIFQEELQGLLNVVGQNLTISFDPGERVKHVNQLNAYPTHTDGKRISYRLGDIFGNEVKALLLELDLPEISEAGQKQIGLLRFEYDELLNGGTSHKVIEVPVMLVVKTAAESPEPQLTNPEVQHSVLLLEAAQARRQAVKAADKGEFESAAQLLRSAAQSIEKSDMHDARLLEEQSALMQQATEMEQGASRYSAYDRKTMSTQALYTMTSRHEDTVMLRVREKSKQTMEAPQHNGNAHEEDIKVTKREGVPPTYVTWKEQTFQLKGELIRIGRSKHNEVIILANGVSRFHCQVRLMGSHLLLEDLGSTNGTMMRGTLLDKPHVLSVGDVVYLCDEKLVFHDGTYNNGTS